MREILVKAKTIRQLLKGVKYSIDVAQSALPFKPHQHSRMTDLDDRAVLYRPFAERIWNRDDLLSDIDW